MLSDVCLLEVQESGSDSESEVITTLPRYNTAKYEILPNSYIIYYAEPNAFFITLGHFIC